MENDGGKRVMTQPEKVDYILEGCAKYFGVTKEEICNSTEHKSRLWNKKRFVFLLLNDYTACNIADIQRLLNYKYHRNISYYIKQLREELSDASYGNRKTKMVYKELLSYLNL